VVDVDDSGELGGEELADGLDLLEELRREGGAVVAEEHEDGEALAVVPAREADDVGVLEPVASEPRSTNAAVFLPTTSGIFLGRTSTRLPQGHLRCPPGPPSQRRRAALERSRVAGHGDTDHAGGAR